MSQSDTVIGVLSLLHKAEVIVKITVRFSDNNYEMSKSFSAVRSDFTELEKIFAMVATPIILVESFTQKILFINHAGEELTGHVLDPNESISFLSLFSDKYENVVSAAVELVKKQGAAFSLRENDIELRRKSGRSCPVNLSIAQMTWANHFLMVVTLEDLSAVKRNEKERQILLEKTAHDMKLIDIGRLAAGMAHELNNPLAILLGHAESLENKVANNNYTPEQLQKSIGPLRKAGLRMSKIVSTMMAKIRNQATKTEVQSLKQVVQDSLAILEGSLAAKSIRLIVEVEDHQWVNCDASQVDQVITNVVMNAMHVLEDLPENREIRIRSFEKPGRTVLEIHNNGAPIPEEIHPQIFNPFFTTKQPGVGTGLGLYMSFNIMKAHSGELSFKTSKSTGTSFFLEFPAVERPLSKAG